LFVIIFLVSVGHGLRRSRFGLWDRLSSFLYYITRARVFPYPVAFFSQNIKKPRDGSIKTAPAPCQNRTQPRSHPQKPHPRPPKNRHSAPFSSPEGLETPSFSVRNVRKRRKRREKTPKNREKIAAKRPFSAPKRHFCPIFVHIDEKVAKKSSKVLHRKMKKSNISLAK
jgi:hypothetical protein